MKILFILTSFMNMALATQASASAEMTSCQGKTNTPDGEFSLIVKYGASGPTLIDVKFHNTHLNEDFVGTFQVTQYQSSNHGLAGNGVLKGLGANIDASIQGSLSSGQAGALHLSIYAGGDDRIEFGYGLHLICKAQK